jgi:hypothetical protein
MASLDRPNPRKAMAGLDMPGSRFCLAWKAAALASSGLATEASLVPRQRGLPGQPAWKMPGRRFEVGLSNVR